jgi:hypothetical protein
MIGETQMHFSEKCSKPSRVVLLKTHDRNNSRQRAATVPLVLAARPLYAV